MKLRSQRAKVQGNLLTYCKPLSLLYLDASPTREFSSNYVDLWTFCTVGPSIKVAKLSLTRSTRSSHDSLCASGLEFTQESRLTVVG